MQIENTDVSNKSLTEKIGTIQQAIFMSTYGLTGYMGQQQFVSLMSQLMMMYSQFQNLILLTIEGEKDLFNRVKEDLESNIKDFMDLHSDLVEETFKKKTEEARSH